MSEGQYFFRIQPVSADRLHRMVLFVRYRLLAGHCIPGGKPVPREAREDVVRSFCSGQAIAGLADVGRAGAASSTPGSDGRAIIASFRLRVRPEIWAADKGFFGVAIKPSGPHLAVRHVERHCPIGSGEVERVAFGYSLAKMRSASTMLMASEPGE